MINSKPWPLVRDSKFFVSTRPVFNNGAWLNVGDEYPTEGNQQTLQALYVTNLIAAAEKSIDKKKRKKKED